MGLSTSRQNRLRAVCALALLGTIVVVPASTSVTAGAGVNFSKFFAPSTIGPGSASTLTLTITSSEVLPQANLSFTDTLPAGLTIATPASASTNCSPNGPVGPTLTALDGGSSISLDDFSVGGSSSCDVKVNVTATTPATYSNSVTLFQNDENPVNEAKADLIVDSSLPGFTKNFAPASVDIGGRSTLTFTIDNSSTGSSISNPNFADDLPAGMVIASPANKTTTCPILFGAGFTATPGSSSISYFGGGTIGVEATCTLSVDVVGNAIGSLDNTSSTLTVTKGSTQFDAGKATAALQVNGVTSLLELAKEFTTDPVVPGGTTTLKFTVTNKSRDDAATNIAFSDDLDATLSGMEAIGAITNTCGGMASSFPAALFDYAGGSLAAESSCTVAIEVSVPDTSADGTYPNVTNAVTGTVGGAPVTGNVAGDTLFVATSPQLTKAFTDDPVGAGGVATLEFTITNPSSSTTISDIEFSDVFDTIITTSPSGEPAAGFCGGGSTATFQPLIPASFDPNAVLSVTGASLARKGDAGDSCTFSITLDVSPGAVGGSYPNATSVTSATLDDVAGTPSVSGPPASDNLVVVGAPRLTKEFTDDPAIPGGTTTLTFTLENLDDTNAASAIAFSDNLTATLAGLTATSVDANDCGATVDIADPTLIDVSGGSLAASATCTITLTLTVPAGGGGTFTNTTSGVTATVAGVPVSGLAATDDLVVSGLLVTKQFIPDSVVPGTLTTLRFSIANTGTVDATNIDFTDDLAAILPGSPDITAAAPLPDTSTCGGASSLTGTTSLTFADGALLAGASCSFDVTLDVPGGAADGNYVNVTSTVTSSLGNSSPAFDSLTIDRNILSATKEFTNDPVAPGGNVFLDITMTNVSATDTITDIAFTDDLDAALSGLSALGALLNTCGGMAGGFPTGSFAYAGGTLTPGQSCTIRLSLRVPDPALGARPFINTTSSFSGKVGKVDISAAPATDELIVDTLEFSKTFDGTTRPTGTAVLTFTINNLDTINEANGLSFSDNLSSVLSGLVATTLPTAPCGPGSVVAGTSFLTLTGGSVPAGGSCSFNVTVTVPAGVTTGSYPNITSALFASGFNVADPASANLSIDADAPTVTIDQAAGQADPTNISPINFTVVFSESVVGFATGDVTLAGTAGATTAAVTGSGTTYNVAVSGMTSDGTVIASLAAGVATDAVGNPNAASTSTDNTVTYDTTGPTMTINQATGQADPTNSSPIVFTVTFDDTPFSFSGGDIALAGTSTGGVAAVSVTANPLVWRVDVTGMSDGTVIATVPAGTVLDSLGNPSSASTSTDNTVEYDATPPVINTPPSPLTVSNDPGEGGANVTYNASATDGGVNTSATLQSGPLVSGSGAIVPPGGVTCTPASGSFFPIGTTTVTCSATDLASNTTVKTFDVVVVDNEKPVLTQPANVSAISTGPAAIAVPFVNPTATDNSGSASVSCSPASDSNFDAGTTTVTCTAVDPSGNSAAVSFTVTVTLSNAVLPETGGGLDLLSVALQVLIAGMVIFSLSRIGRRRLRTR